MFCVPVSNLLEISLRWPKRDLHETAILNPPAIISSELFFIYRSFLVGG